MVASPEPEALETPKPQEVEGVSQEGVLPLEAPRVPKRTRSHSADSRAEGSSDVVDDNESVKRDHKLDTEHEELELSTKLPSENVDNRVSIFNIFLFRSINFFIAFIIISVLLCFVFKIFHCYFLIRYL